MDLKLNIKTEQSLIKYKLKREKDLEDFFNKKKKKRKKNGMNKLKKQNGNILFKIMKK